MLIARHILLLALVLSATATLAQTRITLDSQHRNSVVSPLLFGTNIQWEKNGDHILSGQTGRLDVATLAAVKSLRLSSIRFPGGDLANTYRWKDGIGETRKRNPGRSYAGTSVASTFGTDELIALANEAAIEPIITVNVSAGAAEAADWVEYLNGSIDTRWGALRAAHGNANSLSVKYWEIGNELYSPHQPGHTTAHEYARNVRAFAAAMRARDASIKIGLSLEASFTEAAWMPSVMPHLSGWNEAVLKMVGQEIDFVVLHFYAPHDTVWWEAELSQITLAAPLVFTRSMARISSLLAQYARADVEMALTEFGTAYGEKFVLSKRIAATDSALFAALVLFAAMREPRLKLVNHWSLLNNSQYGMLVSEGEAGLSRRPVYEVYRLLAPFQKMRGINVSITGAPSYPVRAKGSVPAIAEVAMIDAVAAIGDEGQILLAIVNRDPSRTHAIKLALASGLDKAYTARIESVAGKRGALKWNAAVVSHHVGKLADLPIEVPSHAILVLTLGAPSGQKP